MGDKTGIEWAANMDGTPGATWNPVRDLRLVPEKLDQPLRWKNPRMIFGNSMSDLFHEGVSFDYIDRVMAVMEVGA